MEGLLKVKSLTKTQNNWGERDTAWTVPEGKNGMAQLVSSNLEESQNNKGAMQSRKSHEKSIEDCQKKGDVEKKTNEKHKATLNRLDTRARRVAGPFGIDHR